MMLDWLDAQSTNKFTSYSMTHFTALAIFIILLVALYIGRHWLREDRRRNITRYALAGVLILCELSLNIWYVAQDIYDVSSTLPLELCTISLYMCVVMQIGRAHV